MERGVGVSVALCMTAGKKKESHFSHFLPLSPCCLFANNLSLISRAPYLIFSSLFLSLCLFEVDDNGSLFFLPFFLFCHCDQVCGWKTTTLPRNPPPLLSPRRRGGGDSAGVNLASLVPFSLPSFSSDVCFFPPPLSPFRFLLRGEIYEVYSRYVFRASSMAPY